MSQRTRARTTGAAARPTSHTEHANGETDSVEQPTTPPTATEPTAPKRGKRAATTPAPEPAAQEPGLPLQPEALARALRAVATELERDPALAQRVAQAINETPATLAAPSAPSEEPAPPRIGRSFHPTIVTGVAETLGPGVPDPFALRERLGESGLREALASLRLGSLRAIIRQHGLDSSGGLSKLNDAEKLRAHILAATRTGTK